VGLDEKLDGSKYAVEQGQPLQMETIIGPFCDDEERLRLLTADPLENPIRFRMFKTGC
jgi:hypothetical protein